VRVAIHHVTGDRITALFEPLGTVHGVRVICRHRRRTVGLRAVSRFMTDAAETAALWGIYRFVVLAPL